MRELGVDFTELSKVFSEATDDPFLCIRISEVQAASLAAELGVPLRRCYIDDPALARRVAETRVTAKEIVAAKLPDRGSTMAGDFGEILTAIAQACRALPGEALDPKKWRLKQSRNSPAPFSDVVQFILPKGSGGSAEDRVVCAEVKTKSTPGASEPVKDALAHSKKDSDSRLAKTLLWLRERALDTGLSSVDVPTLDRFINATDFPPATWDFRAVVVLCSSLAEYELRDAVSEMGDEQRLVVLVVPNLKATYEGAFMAALESAERTDSGE